MQEHETCTRLRQEMLQQGAAKLDKDAIQNLEMLAESQEELGSLLEAQAARQLQATHQNHTMEDLRQELSQKEAAMESLSQKVSFYKQGWIAEELVLQSVESQMEALQDESRGAQKKANHFMTSELEEQATVASYQVEVMAAQDDIRKLKKSLVEATVQRSENSIRQRQEAKEAQQREDDLRSRASQLETRCKAQEYQLEIARQAAQSTTPDGREGQAESSQALETLCERIRADCFCELESVELTTALAQQEAFQLREEQVEMEMKHDVLMQELEAAKSQGRKAEGLSEQILRLETELAAARRECQGLRSLEAHEGHTKLLQLHEEATSIAETLRTELASTKEEVLQLEQQSVADADSAQRLQRIIAALRTQNEKLKHRYDEVRLSESEATALAIDLELQSQSQELEEAMASELGEINPHSAFITQAAAAKLHLERAAAAECVAHARASELAEQKEILRQECRRLREQNVTLVRQMHEGFTATALQDIKIVAAARSR
eukprot:symbB.v1.2.005842.t1/scaffold343.1/size224757/19